MVDVFKAHGVVAVAILAVGLLAVGAGVLSLVRSKQRVGAKIGLAALGLTALAATLTVGAVMSFRMRADRAAKDLEEPTRTKVVLAAYERTSSLSKLSLVLGVVALGTAAAGTMRGLGAKEEGAPDKPADAEAELGEMSDSTLGLGALVVGALALFSLVAVFMPLVMKPPGLELDEDDPARKFRDAEALLTDGKVAEGCAALEDAYAQGADPKRAKLRSVEGLVTECFDQRLDGALNAASKEDFDKALSELEKTKMPLDDGQRKRLDDALALREKAAAQ
ncbi:MAG: hypothetical protein IPM79_05685 [Polyangiaceae bacterium]|nr:hypothetical protein [Polyangiaceae bacterium]MBK8937131.1 hypothetical protein [Polyangiaceae bacterium]